MKNKNELRRYIKSERKLINIDLVSEKLVYKIRQTTEYQSAQNIMIFYPKKYEINLMDLLSDDKQFYFPKVDGDDLLVCPNDGVFKKSDLNINEPCSKPVNPNIVDLIIVPALAADKNNYRLGYGGGFYDRFLSKYPDIITLLPVCEKFLYDNIPHDKYDIQVNKVISA